MADYSQLRELAQNSKLLNRTESALRVAANNFLDAGTPTAEEIAWSVAVLASPRAEATKALGYILAENRALTVTQIKDAADSALQTNVDAVTPHLVAAMAALSA
jgi:hypothetical protein